MRCRIVVLMCVMFLVSATSIFANFAGARYVKKVEMVTPGGSVISTGSAVLIDPKGLYVTARHVLDGKDGASLKLEGAETQLVAAAVADDIVFFWSTPEPTLAKLDLRGVAEKEKVVAVGFARVSLMSDLITKRENEGAYLGQAVFKDKGPTRFDMFDADVDHGMSGGAVFADADAPTLLGMIVDKSGKKKRSFAVSASKIANHVAVLEASGKVNETHEFDELVEITRIKV